MPPLLADRAFEHLRGATAPNAIMGAFLAAMAAISTQTSALPMAERMAPPPAIKAPVPPPLLLRDVAPDEAEKINRAIPFSTDPNPPAAPFRKKGDRASVERAVECLATAVYYEAGAEPLDGQRAVAQVVLNRVRHPAFEHTVCGVIYQGSTQRTGCQFSFTCDGSLSRPPDYRGWRTARAIAAAALAGAVFKPVGYATHYHADYVVPYWASSIDKNSVVGRHIFYRWPEWWGSPAAFAARYAGKEADPRMLRATALRTVETVALETQTPSLPDEDLDREKELVRILQMLAARSPANAELSDYDRAVSLRFSKYSEHVAVQIYRQLSAEKGFKPDALAESLSRDTKQASVATPQTSRLAAFEATVADFAKQSGFDEFFLASHPSLPRTVRTASCADCGPAKAGLR